tara:strand:+ start:28 stop:924 length:897 start_codon:yes stop_codon:yes gene_type:complete
MVESITSPAPEVPVPEPEAPEAAPEEETSEPEPEATPEPTPVTFEGVEQWMADASPEQIRQLTRFQGTLGSDMANARRTAAAEARTEAEKTLRPEIEQDVRLDMIRQQEDQLLAREDLEPEELKGFRQEARKTENEIAEARRATTQREAAAAAAEQQEVTRLSTRMQKLVQTFPDEVAQEVYGKYTDGRPPGDNAQEQFDQWWVDITTANAVHQAKSAMNGAPAKAPEPEAPRRPAKEPDAGSGNAASAEAPMDLEQWSKLSYQERAAMEAKDPSIKSRLYEPHFEQARAEAAAMRGE